MKILHVAESIRGGCGTYLNETVPAQIAELGRENMRVLVPAQHASHLSRIDPGCLRTFHRPRRSLGLFFMAAAAGTILKSFRPDVVHLHSTFAGVVIRLMAPLLARRSFIVYCPHGWVFDVEMPAAPRRLLGRIERLLATLTGRIVAISHYEYEAGKKIGIDPGKLVEIVNGIRDLVSKRQAVWNDKRLRVLFVGRMDVQKGFDVLVRAVYSLEDQVTVRAIGAAIHSAGKSAGNESAALQNVEMLGWMGEEDIAAHMLACDVIVIPSRWEGFGLVAIEAMRAGKAVVATSVGGLRSIVVDGITGRLIPKNDAQSLAMVLTSRSASDWAEMGQAGRTRYLELYTVDRVHRELMSLYRQTAPDLRRASAQRIELERTAHEPSAPE
ncbi:MAG: glycosyltransferase [Terracidiphilus sp.]